MIEGTVLGPDGKPLEGVCILVYKSHTTAFTDQDGKFEIYHPLRTGSVIIFSYIGFETKEYKITSSDPKIINLKETFLQCDLAWLGEVSVEHVYASKRTFWQKITGIFK